MVRATPHPSLAVASWREPAPGRRGHFGAVCGLPLTVVNHGLVLSWLDGESLGVAVAGLGRAAHSGRGSAELCHLPGVRGQAWTCPQTVLRTMSSGPGGFAHEEP